MQNLPNITRIILFLSQDQKAYLFSLILRSQNTGLSLILESEMPK